MNRLVSYRDRGVGFVVSVVDVERNGLVRCVSRVSASGFADRDS